MHLIRSLARVTCGGLVLLQWSCNEQDNVRAFAADDPSMAAAMESARASVPQFAAFLQDDTSSITFRAVKVRLEAPVPEHIWVDSVSFDGTTFRGVLNEDAVYGPAKAGDSIAVAASAISDWMVVVGGELCGGYTVRVARSSAPDTAAFDSGLAALGLRSWRMVAGC